MRKRAKKKASDLLRGFQTLSLTGEDLIKLEKPIQVRFT